MNEHFREEPLINRLDKIKQEYQRILTQADIRELADEEKEQIENFDRQLQRAYAFLEEYADILPILEAEDEFESPEIEEMVALAVGDVIGLSEEDIELGEEDLSSKDIQTPGHQNDVSGEGFVQRIKKFLASPNNRNAVQGISQGVLLNVKPEEAETSTALINPLIEMLRVGQVVRFGAVAQAGSFGGTDLLISFIVPLVIAIVGDLLEKLSKVDIQEVENMVSDGKDIEALVEMKLDDIETVVSLTQYSGGKKQVEKMAKAVNAALLEYLQNRV